MDSSEPPSSDNDDDDDGRDEEHQHPRRSVRFQLIELIEIAIVLGDSPSLSTGGPPMSLGWDPVRRTEFDLDYYEKNRPKRKESRRDLIISGKKRTKFFLRCGYSLSEIEEAAAISLNYRKHMTITKLLGGEPEKMVDKVKNRFASSQEPEPHSQRHRISRRHSMEPLMPPRREPEVNYDPTSEVSDGPLRPPPRFQMTRRLSNYEPDTGPMKRISRENIDSSPAWRTKSPTKFERRNSPTAAPTSPIPSIEHRAYIQLPSRDNQLPQLPSRTISPETERRNNLRRHRSAPLSKYLGLRMPVRTLSPIPPKAETKSSNHRTHRTHRTAPLTDDDKKQPHSLPNSRVGTPALPQRSISPIPDKFRASPAKPFRRLSPPIKLQMEVPPTVADVPEKKLMSKLGFSY